MYGNNKKRKFILLLCDGMSDRPTDLLSGKTPMQVARKKNMDFLASNGLIGTAATLPDEMHTGSDVANLSILGYDPRTCHTGRSPIEAEALGIEMLEGDMAFRCNLVTLSGKGMYEEKVMKDYSAGEISTEESSILIRAVAEKLGNEHIKFYPGISYRHCMIHKKPAEKYVLTPPHDIISKCIRDYLPEGPGAGELISIMKAGADVLASHPVNIEREKKGLNPANSIWLWGEGKKIILEPFREKYGLDASVVAAVDLIKGIARAAGMKFAPVEGATGNFRTNYKGKAEAALKELDAGKDFVFIHVEAPDECGHQGKAEEKVKAIEKIDEELLGTLLEGLGRFEAYSILVTSDHSTPLDIRTHSRDPVPWLLYKSDEKPLKQMHMQRQVHIHGSNGFTGFNEAEANATGIKINGTECMDVLTGVRKPA